MRWFFLLILTTFCIEASGQVSDFIAVKRKGRSVKSFFPGSQIAIQTVYGNYFNGIVSEVKNDTIFIRQYDVRAIPNAWGVYTVDTLGSFVAGTHYHDIRRVLFERKESFRYIKNGNIFIIGGIGYAALNLINGKYLKQPITSRDNIRNLGIASAVAGTGIIIKFIYNEANRFERKYRIEYIRMN
jgi:hypothetical protein